MRGMYLSIFITFLMLVSVFSLSAGAFELIKSDDFVNIDRSIEDDVYTAGSNVIIQNTVQGDVVVAGGRVEISGDITGDVIAAGGEVVIHGNVEDDVRIAGGRLTINGKIGDDLIAAGSGLVVSRNAQIGGDMVFGARQVELMGNIDGDVQGDAESVTLGGTIGGNVDIEVADIEVMSGSRINGHLNYTSTNEAEIPSGTVGGEINFVDEDVGKEEGFAFLSVVWWILKYLALLVVGLVVLKLWPNRSMSIVHNIETSPLKNIGIGILLAIVGFIVPILLFITVIGIPLGIALLFITLFSLYAVRLFIGLWIGKFVFSKLGKESTRSSVMLAVGLFLLLILGSIPWVGILIYLLATLVTIGAVYYEVKKHYQELKDKDML